HGEEVIVTHVGPDGPGEVARHRRTTPGNPRIDDSHFPPAPEGALDRTPVAANAAEAEFLAIGAGAALWLKEAGAVGTTRVRAKMAEAVALAKLSGKEAVDWALGHAAVYSRFAEGDLASILAHRGAAGGATNRAGEAHSLQAGTNAWAEFGR
ncbi:MAG: IS21 family transposase, partial [Acidimicrobiales bacterium]